MSDKNNIDELPSYQEFYVNTPLYEQFILPEPHDDQLQLLLKCNSIDAFCEGCHNTTIFINKTPKVVAVHTPGNPQPGSTETIIPIKQIVRALGKDIDYYQISFHCTRNVRHSQSTFYLKYSHGRIMKIGQHPSLVDLTYSENKQYNKVLSEEKFREFKRAIGLASHGIGIGSFIYLRRIIEDLVEEAHASAKKGDSWDETVYERLRMVEKIKILKKYLPDFLVDNKKIFSILSKGVHELDENECLSYFKPLRVGIELTLDQKLEQIKRDEKIESTSKDISQIEDNIKKNQSRPK